MKEKPGPPFQLGNPVPPELFINRKKELETIDWAISANRHILIYGPRRIGKTSTLSKIKKLYEGQYFIIHIRYFIESHNQLSDLFKHIVTDICRAVLEKVFSIRIPSINTLKLKDLKQDLSGDLNLLINLYQSLKTNRTITLNSTNKIGVKALATADKEQKSSIKYDNLLFDFEDMQSILIDILEIINKNGYDQTLLFIDDINGNLEFLLSKEGTQLLQFLSESGLLMILTAWDNSVKNCQMPISFLETLSFSGFSHIENVKDLIELYTKPPVYNGNYLTFTNDLIELIWKITLGHPQFIQELAFRCYRMAQWNDSTVVTKEMIYEHALDLIRRNASVYL